MVSVIKPVLLTTSTYGGVVLSMFMTRLFRPFGLLRVIGVLCYISLRIHSLVINWHYGKLRGCKIGYWFQIMMLVG